MSEAVNTQTQTLEETLNKTDLGHMIYEYRKLFFGALVAVLVAACGYVLWKQSKATKAQNIASQVFEFQNKIWADAKANKLPPADLVSSFNKLDKDVQSAPLMLPVVLEIGKFLYEKGLYQEADSVLSNVSSSYQHEISNFFITMQRAVVLEKLGKLEEAITLLEKLAQNKDVLMPAKVSVELGRLNLLKGDKGKAQTQFDYVINTYPNDEQAKLAKLYLSQLAQ